MLGILLQLMLFGFGVQTLAAARCCQTQPLAANRARLIVVMGFCLSDRLRRLRAYGLLSQPVDPLVLFALLHSISHKKPGFFALLWLFQAILCWSFAIITGLVVLIGRIGISGRAINHGNRNRGLALRAGYFQARGLAAC